MSIITPATSFLQELEQNVDRLQNFLLNDRYRNRFHPIDIEEAVTLYVSSGGKRLRPAILLWSCGAMGGVEESALPAAAAVEIFHTWTLVHDDIIDRDELRRGSDTVHERFRKVALSRHPDLPDDEASHYGTSVAILAGDLQHGWGISMMSELTRERGVDPAVTLHLINDLDTEVLNLLVEGEILDLQFSRQPIDSFSVDNIEDMLWKKTGVLYKFCSTAGALIGLGRVEPDHPHVLSLGEFSRLCGIAFQLQDDILGVVGDKKAIGKPVGSDIREGKRTTIIHYAWENAEPVERDKIRDILGRADAEESEIREIVEILKNRGGVEQTRQRAQLHIEAALPHLESLPPSRYKDLLRSWADYMISRNS